MLSTGYDLQYEWFGPDNVTIGEGALATGVFPAGTTEVTLKVTDGYGGTSYDYVSITVSDPIPLVLTCTTDLGVLWPPNHEMRPVTIFVGAAGMEGDVQVNCVVTSNEPDDGTGDGAFTGDVDLTDGWESPVPVPLVYDATLGLYVGEVLLRAERDGDGAGRTYSIHCAADDGKQQAATASTAVIVPRGGRK